MKSFQFRYGWEGEGWYMQTFSHPDVSDSTFLWIFEYTWRWIKLLWACCELVFLWQCAWVCVCVAERSCDYLHLYSLITRDIHAHEHTHSHTLHPHNNNNNRSERRNSRFFFLQSPHCAVNCLQHVCSSGQAPAHCALIMSCATWCEGTVQRLSLTELKSHLF